MQWTAAMNAPPIFLILLLVSFVFAIGCSEDLSRTRQPRRTSTSTATTTEAGDSGTNTNGRMDTGFIRDAQTEVDAALSYPDAMVPDAGMSTPCPALEPGDQGVWYWLPQHEYCVYSSRSSSNRKNYRSAERRCDELGASLPTASQLDPLCPDLLFRDGATSGGRQVRTRVWVRDTFQSGHKLWSDSGYNELIMRCSSSNRDYRCGTEQYNSSCQQVTSWSRDSTQRDFACLKRVRR